MLIVSDDFKFGVLWEVYEQSDDKSWTYGIVRPIIDGEIFPKKTRFNDTINVIFHNMKHSFSDPYYPAGNTGIELGDRPVSSKQLRKNRVSNIILIGLGELDMYYYVKGYADLQLYLGYHNDQERLFYSEDCGRRYREIVLRRGTVEGVIARLPSDSLL